MKITKQTMTVEDLISSAQGEIESLKDELQSWYDNLPESFQNGSKGDQLTEAIDQLDSTNVDQLEVPEVLKSVGGEVGYIKATSRSKRAQNSEAELRAAEQVASDWLDKPENAESEHRDEVKSFQNDAASAADELGNVMFPVYS